jgi:putative transposase
VHSQRVWYKAGYGQAHKSPQGVAIRAHGPCLSLVSLVVLGRSIHTDSGMVSYEPKMARFLRKDARMTTAVAPSLSISPRVQLTARQRACLEQIARRQPSPQRLVRRAKILWALETGAPQCHVMRQLHLNRGTVQGWGRRWCALASKLEYMEADGSSATVLTTGIVEAFTDHPRAGTPAPFPAQQMVQLVAVAWEDPADSGRPVSPGTPREVAEDVRQRGMVETISTRSVGRFFQSGGCAAPAGRGLAQRHAGCPRGLDRPRGGRVCSVAAGASRGPGRRPWHQYGCEDRETSAGACRPHLAEEARVGRAP